MSAEEDVKITSKGAGGLSLTATEDGFISVGNELHLSSDASMFLTSGDVMNIQALGNILNTGEQIHLNGPPAGAATVGEDAAGVSRKPDHEPWARTMLDPTTGEPELPYDSPDVGRKEGTEELPRNPNWHR